MNTDFKPGDRVAFDVEGNKQSPYGYGIVTHVGEKGGVRFTPDVPFPLGFVVADNSIRKVGQ